MTPKQLEILQHSLGVDEFGQGKMYRNHFCAGDADEDICRELVAYGLHDSARHYRMASIFQLFRDRCREAGDDRSKPEAAKAHTFSAEISGIPEC